MAAWHDRIADDKQEEGWSLKVRWLPALGSLVIWRQTYHPDGRLWEADRTTYGPLTQPEAHDVLEAVLEECWAQQLHLFT
uniref:Uncharacterized protein n=1 Tax=uncultured prokaryote TaxID=198431 RepID=A0A0H5QLV8_9ZZZZ|nr:hypothetical protein [uncultured prokaryote]